MDFRQPKDRQEWLSEHALDNQLLEDCLKIARSYMAKDAEMHGEGDTPRSAAAAEEPVLPVCSAAAGGGP